MIVEGKSDEIFLKRVLEVDFRNSVYSVIRAGSDSRIKELIYMASSFFADIQKSPYRDRIFPIIDSVHTSGLVDEIEKMGIPRDNIIVWSENGIEHYYPSCVIDDIYGAGGPLQIDVDNVCRNGITYKKLDLAEKVTAQISPNMSYPKEFRTKFLEKLRAISE